MCVVTDNTHSTRHCKSKSGEFFRKKGEKLPQAVFSISLPVGESKEWFLLHHPTVDTSEGEIDFIISRRRFVVKFYTKTT